MTAIWLLSTRGRPKACQQVVDACTQAGMSSPGVVYVDETVDEYRNLKLPDNWRIHLEPVWGSLRAAMSWCLTEYPDATRYGWLADDTYPRTPGWDSALEEAAGDWSLACAADDWLSNTDQGVQQLVNGDLLSSGLCWGGQLVRAVGAWAVPETVTQAGIDTAWLEIVRPLDLHRYVPDVLVEHKNWRTKKRRKDAGDDWERDGRGYIEQDIVEYRAWHASDRYRTALDRIEAHRPDLHDRIHAAKRMSSHMEFVTTQRNFIPQSRQQRLQAEAEADLHTHTHKGPAGPTR